MSDDKPILDSNQRTSLETELKPVLTVPFKHAMLSTVLVSVVGLVLFVIYEPAWWGAQKNILKSVFYGVFFGLLLYVVIFFLTVKFNPIAKHVKPLLFQLRDIYQPFTWPQILIASAFAGFGEELLLRGIIQDWITTWAPVWIAILIASVIFGFLHFLNWTYVVFTFGMGLVFGIVFHITQDIIIVMVAHGVYDVIGFAVLMKYPGLIGFEKAS